MFNRNKSETFATADPVYAYENDTVIFKDGRVGVGFLLHSPEMERWARANYEQSQTQLADILKQQPANTIFQKTDLYFYRDSITKDHEDQYFTSRQKEHFSGRSVLHHRSFIFLSYAPAGLKKPVKVTALNALIVRAGEAIQKNPFAALPDTLEIAARGAADLINSLRNMQGVWVERLPEAQLRELYAQYFSLSFDQPETSPTREISVNRHGLLVGENAVNVVSMIGQGTQAVPVVANSYQVVSPMLYPLTHFLPFPHVTTQAIRVTDSRKELKALDSDRKVNSQLGMVGTQDNAVRVEEIDMFTAEVRANNKVLTELHLSVLLWEINSDRRKEHVNATMSAFRTLFGAESVVESTQTLQLFFGLVPGNAWQIPDRWIMTSADRAACFVHWTTTYRPDPRGELICDRFNNLVRINLFDTTMPNMNALVVGPSGMGKSYTFGYFIIQRFERGNQQIIIDNGGTYFNMVQALTGPDFNQCYLEYDPVKPIAFNPFLVQRDPTDQSWNYDSSRQLLHLALFALLLKKPLANGDTAVGLSKPEEALISKLLIGYYRHLNEQTNLGEQDELYPGMQTFYEFARARDERLTTKEFDATDMRLVAEREQYAKDCRLLEMHQFFTILEQFVAGGRYAPVLNARMDKDLSEYPLVCFDLKAVKADLTLYPIVGLLITQLSIDLFARRPDAVKYFVLDEAWSLLSGLQDFIETMYRTVRKMNGSITIITQDSNDVANSPIAAAIMTNTNNRIILRHPADKLADLSRNLGLTPHEMDLVRSMRDLGAMREIFIKQDQVGKVFGLSVAPQLDPVLTSTAWQRNYFSKLVKLYSRQRRQLCRDEAHRLILDEHGNPTYETVTEQNLGMAADHYMEDKRAHVGPFAK